MLERGADGGHCQLGAGKSRGEDWLRPPDAQLGVRAESLDSAC